MHHLHSVLIRDPSVGRSGVETSVERNVIVREAEQY
jgi:hypothetical protein